MNRDPTAMAARVGQLSPARKTLLRQWLARVDSAPGRGQLVACVRAQGEVDANALREHLRERVPDYMVPQRIVTLAELPRTAAGKIDRHALAQRCVPDEHTNETQALVAPRNDIETRLAAIWADVLGFDDIDVHDDFFEVGGDSLLSIRILSRASKEGLAITPEDFFAHPTIAAQAALAQPAGTRRVARGPVSGALPLTPIQRWFFSRITTRPEHWNQSLLFTLSERLSVEQLTRAANKLITHHDALRSAFFCRDGVWQAHIEPAGSYDVVSAVDLAGLDAAARRDRVARHADRLNAGFDLARAPLLRLAHFHGGDGAPDQLLVVAHHLLLDAQSWALLIDDLQTLCAQLLSAAPMQLPDKTSTVTDWATRLDDYARSDAVTPMARWWADTMARPRATLAADVDTPAEDDTEAGRRTLTTSLDEATTRGLLDRVPGALRITVNEALVSALGRTLAAHGTGAVCFDMEGHGREALFEEVDVSRTIGWFTSVFPVVLPDTGDSAWAQPRAAARAAKQTLRELPLNGLSHGLVVRRAAQTPLSGALLLNYLGRQGRAGAGDLLRLADPRCGVARDPRCPRAYPIEVNAYIENDRLVAEWAYCGAAFHAPTVSAMAEGLTRALCELVAAAQEPDSAVVTPADFPLAGLDQQELDDLSDILDDMDS